MIELIGIFDGKQVVLMANIILGKTRITKEFQVFFD